MFWRKRKNVVEYSINVGKQIGWGESASAQFVVKEGESVEKIVAKFNKILKVFDQRVAYNNERELKLQEEERKKEARVTWH